MEYNIFWKQVELEEYSIYFVYSTSESGIAGRVNSDDIFRWTLVFYSGVEFFLFHLNSNRWSSEYLFQVFLFLKILKRNAAKAPILFSKTTWKIICRRFRLHISLGLPCLFKLTSKKPKSCEKFRNCSPLHNTFQSLHTKLDTKNTNIQMYHHYVQRETAFSTLSKQKY